MKIIVIAWLSTRVSGCPNVARTYPCAAVWTNDGTDADRAKAETYAAQENARQDGTSDHTVFEYPAGITDPLTRARESVAALVGAAD